MQLYKMGNEVIERIGFKEKMSELEIYGTEAVINELHADDHLPMRHQKMGLAYTSSSSYAMLNVCNEVPYDRHMGGSISHFAVLTDGRLVMVASDNDSNYTYFIIE